MTRLGLTQNLDRGTMFYYQCASDGHWEVITNSNLLVFGRQKRSLLTVRWWKVAFAPDDRDRITNILCQTGWDFQAMP